MTDSETHHTKSASNGSHRTLLTFGQATVQARLADRMETFRQQYGKNADVMGADAWVTPHTEKRHDVSV
jgi:hypothetical protein